MLKGTECGLGELEGVLAKEIREWRGDGGEAANEATVVTGKSQEGADFFKRARWRPVDNGVHFS